MTVELRKRSKVSSLHLEASVWGSYAILQQATTKDFAIYSRSLLFRV